MKYTLGFYIDHIKNLKLYYLVSNEWEEYISEPNESIKDFLERLGIDLKDVEVTNSVMENKYK
jgi:hypothetical protein